MGQFTGEDERAAIRSVKRSAPEPFAVLGMKSRRVERAAKRRLCGGRCRGGAESSSQAQKNRHCRSGGGYAKNEWSAKSGGRHGISLRLECSGGRTHFSTGLASNATPAKPEGATSFLGGRKKARSASKEFGHFPCLHCALAFGVSCQRKTCRTKAGTTNECASLRGNGENARQPKRKPTQLGGRVGSRYPLLNS